MDNTKLDSALLEQIVNQVLKAMNEAPCTEECPKEEALKAKLGLNDYPLIAKRKDLIKTNTGKGIDDINIINVIDGTIKPEDIKITPEVLLYQAEIAESVGRYQFARNLRRAAELTVVPDERVLQIYNALRPYRSTKQELLDIADELENKYKALVNAKLVREAAEVYEMRGRLKV